MNKLPLVSIITVVFDGEKHLEQTIQSVINQTYQNIEYIIIDGGSKDGTIDIIKKYKEHLSYWCSEPDNGLYDAMNKGIKKAKGTLIGMINSDDWYEKNAVEVNIKEFLKNPDKNIFHADRYDIDNQGERELRKFNPSTFKLKYYDMTYNHPSMFITKQEYTRQLYNTNLTVMSDFQFVLNAFLENRNTFHYIEKAIVNYRLEGVSAQIGIIKVLKEGFIARQNAGMHLHENIISVFVRCNIPLLRFLNRKFSISIGTFLIR